MILLGDCIERLKELGDNSVDSVVTDPPYGLKFMGKKWDYDVPSIAVWTEIARVLKPGGHVLSFGGTRTYHRMVCVIEDAGLEIRDQLQWLYGSGFPKSLSIDKAIDKLLGAKREVIGHRTDRAAKPVRDNRGGNYNSAHGKPPLDISAITAPATPEAYRYKGWGTALKPANEPIVLARKPLEKGLTVAENMLKWGVGGLNIDESRIGTEMMGGQTIKASYGTDVHFGGGEKRNKEVTATVAQGRWPANLLLDETAAQMLDEQSIAGGIHSAGKARDKATAKTTGHDGASWSLGISPNNGHRYADENIGASRFFYVAKASKRERNAGLEGMPEIWRDTLQNVPKDFKSDGREARKSGSANQNFHPTVKPIKLMEYLCKLITPHGGTILDPFCGSGSTGVAAFKNGFKFIGIEMSPEYCAIAEKRIAHASSDE